MKKQFSNQKRKEMICKLYMANFSMDQIAKELGYKSPDEVKEIIYAFLDEYEKVSIKERRWIMDVQINEMHKLYWSKALGKNNTSHEEQLKASYMILKLLDKRCKLHGLDKKVKYSTQNEDQKRFIIKWDVYSPLEKQIDKWDKKMKEVIKEARKTDI